MKIPPSLPLAAAAAVLAALALAAPRAAAQDRIHEVLDQGRFVIASHGVPVALEDFEYERGGDSLYITSYETRNARSDDGTMKPYMKSMQLMVSRDDFALLGYLSTEKFDGHRCNRLIMVNDTLLTVAIDKDEAGTADRLIRLPGRLYVMDPNMYTLFDVVARNLHGHLVAKRQVPMVMLGEQNQCAFVDVAPAGRDTLRWGGRRVVADRMTIGDAGSTYTLWTDEQGRMLRLENAAADLVVMRKAPDVPAPAKRRAPPKDGAPAPKPRTAK